jgi:hypothetical protein
MAETTGGEANGALRDVMRQFRGFGNQRHPHQIRTDDGDVREPESQEVRPGRSLVQCLNQFARPFRHAISFCHFNHMGFGTSIV